jgi:hypothetical protein
MGAAGFDRTSKNIIAEDPRYHLNVDEDEYVELLVGEFEAAPVELHFDATKGTPSENNDAG